jgi:hypothetical protein
MDRYQSPIASLPDEHMRMVGIISTHWEWIELILERAVAETMLHEPDRVAALTANVGFHQKCDIILAYANHFKADDAVQWKLFTKTIETLRNAYSVRNKFVHAKWKMVGDQINRTEILTRGGKFTITDEPCPIQELNLAAQQIADAGVAFVKLVQPFGVLAS